MRGQDTSWTDLYESKGSEIASPKAVFEEPFESVNDITWETREGVDLAITIASRPYNFLILTSDSNQVNLLHHYYNTTKTGNAARVGIGIYGSRRSSPFKAFNPTQAMLVLQPPARPKKDKTNSSFPLKGSSQPKLTKNLRVWKGTTKTTKSAA
jgi:hypothetical protein